MCPNGRTNLKRWMGQATTAIGTALQQLTRTAGSNVPRPLMGATRYNGQDVATCNLDEVIARGVLEDLLCSLERREPMTFDDGRHQGYSVIRTRSQISPGLQGPPDATSTPARLDTDAPEARFARSLRKGVVPIRVAEHLQQRGETNQRVCAVVMCREDIQLMSAFCRTHEPTVNSLGP